MSPPGRSSNEGVDEDLELLLARLGARRDAMAQALSGLSASAAAQRPRGTTQSLVDITRRLTEMERRWRELDPTGAPAAPERGPIAEGDADPDAVVARYRARAAQTDDDARRLTLDAPTPAHPQAMIRWALLCLLQETARGAGRAEVVRELITQPMGELEPE
jgi:hypothetical protein